MTSVMRETIWRQPEDLRALLGDPAPVEAQAERLRFMHGGQAAYTPEEVEITASRSASTQ